MNKDKAVASITRADKILRHTDFRIKGSGLGNIGGTFPHIVCKLALWESILQSNLIYACIHSTGGLLAHVGSLV